MNPAKTIFTKELREMLRDKRVLTSVLVGPVFMMVLFMGLFSFLMASVKKPKSLKLHMVRSAALEPFEAMLKDSKGLSLIFVDSAEAGLKKVREGEAMALLEAERESRPLKLKVTFDPDEQKAPLIVSALEEVTGKASRTELESILSGAGLSKDLAEPVQLEKVVLKKEKAMAGALLLGFLPYLIVIWAFYGGIGTATELVAGEKEKNTLETLLIAPISRTRIALGKFWALMAVCLTSSLVTLLSMMAVGFLKLPISKELFPNGMNVDPLGFLALLAAVVPMTAMFAGILLAISCFAKNVREAQTHTTLVSFIVLLPAVFSQVIGYSDFAKEWWIGLIPVLNAAGVIRESLLGKVDGAALFLTVVSSLILALASIKFSIALFRREEILART